MAQVLCVVLAFWAASVNGFLPNSARSLSHKRLSYLSAGFNVGDTIIAEVDDILGTVSDPKVSFLIRNGGKTSRASMSTKLLSPTERLALQAGSVMQVYISKVDADEMVQVSLKPIDGIKPVVIREAVTEKAESKTFKPVRVLTKPHKVSEKVAPKIPTGGLLLSNLKTGMELDGIVQSCTAYAAFISTGVYRAGKGGSFQAINGMLHKVDIVDRSYLAVGSRKSSYRNNRGYDSSENTADGIISVGTRIKVYVKEVYKQSGRLTLTTDSTIDKLRVREQKLGIKSAGNDRRRARRLRRQLEKVAVGDTVSGVIQQVIPAGILVSVNSLGPLNVTGLIAKRDLPKQFEVPPDLKESFQKQLLEQDFAVGRQITCGVLQVNPNVGEKVAYNLKMLFEELGALAADTVQIRDSGDKSESSTDVDDIDAPEEVFDDSDLKEIFDELRGAKPLMSVSDLKDWGDVQDMLESKIIDLDDLDGAVQEVTGKPKGNAITITFEQFVEIVDMLQDAMEGMTTDLDAFGDDEDEDEEIVAAPASSIVKPAVKLSVTPPPAQKTKMVLQLDSEAEDEVEGEDDETMKEVALELFEELKGESTKLTVKAFKSWSDVTELVENELITLKDLDAMITDVVGSSKHIDFEQFYNLVSSLDEVAEDEETIMEESEGDDDDKNQPSVEVRRAVAADGFDLLRGLNDKVQVKDLKVSAGVLEMLEDRVITPEQLEDIVVSVAGSKKQVNFEEFYMIATKLDKTAVQGNLYLEGADDDETDMDNSEDADEIDGDADADEELDEEDLKEVAKELFDELRGKDKKVSVAAFMAWGDVKDMIADEVVTKEEIMEIISEAADGKKVLDFDQFYEVVSQLDGIAEDADEMDDDTMKEVALELFDELRGKKKLLPVADFMNWEDVKELLADGSVTKEYLNTKLAGLKSLDFDQFFDIVKDMDSMGDDADDDETDMDNSEDADEIDGDADADEELDEEDLKEVAKELFDELRGKDKKVSVAAFMAWGDVKDMIADEVVTKEEIMEIISEAADGKKVLDFDQFYEVVSQLDGIAEDADEMDDDTMKEVALELFDELRGKKKLLPVADFMNWEDVKELLADGSVTKEYLNTKLAGLKSLDFDQFFDIVKDMDSMGDDADDDETDMDNSEDADEIDGDADADEELDEEDLKEVAKELFDELRGKDKKVSVAAFMAWGDVKDMIADEVVTKEEIMEIISEAADGKKVLDFDQFYEVVSQLDGIAEDADEMDDDTMKEVALELFDELRGKKKLLPVADFMNWEDVKELLADGSVTKEYLNTKLAGLKSLDFDQFFDIVKDMDSMGDDADDDETDMDNSEDADEIDGDADADEELDEEDLKEVAKELFDELRGKDKKVSVAAFMAWGDVKDMIADEVVTKEEIMEIISEAADGKKVLDFDQFYQVVGQLDEIAEGEDEEDYIDYDEDDEDEDEEIVAAPASSIVKPAVKLSVTPPPAQKTKMVLQLDSEAEDEVEGEDDETMKEVALELFEELKGESTKLTVKAFKSWSDVTELVENELITLKDLDAMITDVVGSSKHIDFEQFYNLVSSLDEVAEDEETIMEESEGDDDDKNQPSVEVRRAVAADGFDLLRGLNDKVQVKDLKVSAGVLEMLEDRVITPEQLEDIVVSVAGSKKQVNFEEFYMIATKLDKTAVQGNLYLEGADDDETDMDNSEDADEIDGDADADEELDEEDLKEVAKELFDELRGKDKKVSVAAFMAWGDVKDMIADEVVTKEEIMEIISEAADGKKVLDFDQFYEVVSQLDGIAEDADEMDDDTMKEVALELFDELRGKKKLLPVADFMNWEDVKELLADGSVTKEYLNTKLAGLKSLDFDQFFDIVKDMDSMGDDADDDETDMDNSEDADEIDGDADADEELDEEDLKEVAKELFDELRGKDKKVSVAAFMAWGDVKDMIADEVVTKEEIMEIISEAADGKKVLDFDQFYEVVSQLDGIAEDADEMNDEEDDAEILPSSKGFGKEADESMDDFEDLNDEEVDEMLREVYSELKGKGKALSLKAFKKWEDIVEMLDTKIIDEKEINSLASKVGCEKGQDLTYPMFKALVELLDEVAGEEDDSEEMSPRDSEREGDDEDRLELDGDDIGGDGSDEEEEMTPEEVEEMTRDLFDTLKGSKKTLSVATFLSWDNIQDEELLDDATIDILLEEVGANKNRKGDLSYKQFSDLINLLEETVTAMGDGQGQGMDTIMSDEDDKDEDTSSAKIVSATLEEREEIDKEIEEERNERNVLDGIDDEGVDEIANEIYQGLKGKDKLLSVKAFQAWEDVTELIEQGIIKKSTVEMLIKEVGAEKSQTLTFDQFWQLVNLLESASDAAADKAAADLDEDDDGIDMSPEEEEEMTREIFDGLKNPKTGLMSTKKIKNWTSVAEALDSGELSKGMLNSVIKKFGSELDFEKFKELIEMLEVAMDEGVDIKEEDNSGPVMNVSGKGFARSSEPAITAPMPVVEAPKKVTVKVPVVVKEKKSEATAITEEIFDDLRGKRKTVSVEALKEWEDMQEMIESGSLKRSSLEKALVKIGSLETGEITLPQFMQLIDIIQGSVDDSNLKYEYEEEASGKDKRFETSKKSSVLNGDDEEEEEENWGDDESGGDFETLTEEEAARQAFEELLVDGSDRITLVDFLQWEDVQELLEVGALSKDDLATAIENAGVSVEQDGIEFEKFYKLLQVIDEFVDREKLPAEQSDVVFENKITIDKDTNVDAVMSMVDGLIGDDEGEDNLKITYLSNKNGAGAAEGDAAIRAMQDDLEEDDEEDEEVMEMFEELSKGKDYITEKALRKWDELQELIEADLATQEAIDSYIARIEIKNGRVSLKSFKHFMRMLDMVIVDESGNFLSMDDADKAVDMDSLDGETDDEED